LTLKMEARRYVETPVTVYQSIRRNIRSLESSVNTFIMTVLRMCEACFR